MSAGTEIIKRMDSRIWLGKIPRKEVHTNCTPSFLHSALDPYASGAPMSDSYFEEGLESWRLKLAERKRVKWSPQLSDVKQFEPSKSIVPETPTRKRSLSSPIDSFYRPSMSTNPYVFPYTVTRTRSESTPNINYTPGKSILKTRVSSGLSSGTTWSQTVGPKPKYLVDFPLKPDESGDTEKSKSAPNISSRSESSSTSVASGLSIPSSSGNVTHTLPSSSKYDSLPVLYHPSRCSPFSTTSGLKRQGESSASSKKNFLQ